MIRMYQTFHKISNTLLGKNLPKLFVSNKNELFVSKALSLLNKYDRLSYLLQFRDWMGLTGIGTDTKGRIVPITGNPDDLWDVYFLGEMCREYSKETERIAKK